MHHKKVEAGVQSKFTELLRSLDGNTEKWTSSLMERYSEAQRKYHTIHHIHSMLRCFDSSESQINDHIAVKLFIYFHDWVYDPMRHDNELQSIAVFEEFASELKLPQELRRKVSHYIKATIAHSMDSDDALKFCLDFDLEVLGREPAEYDVYASQIREEYCRYSEKEYAMGRIGVLRKFLTRERLLFTDDFHGRLEERARRNLEREIADLELQGEAE